MDTKPLPLKDSPAQWVFEWKTVPVGLFQHLESGWVLEGRPNASPGTGWIVAHDVFHHLPTDRGSYAEEVASLGAQTWFDWEPPNGPIGGLEQSLSDSWFGVMGLVIENGTRGVSGLLLENPAGSRAEDFAREPLALLWRQAYLQAVRLARLELGEYTSAEEWEALISDPMVERAVGVVRSGFEQASRRWPNRVRAKGDFACLEQLATPGQEGDRITIKWEGEGMVLDRQPLLRPTPKRTF